MATSAQLFLPSQLGETFGGAFLVITKLKSLLSGLTFRKPIPELTPTSTAPAESDPSLSDPTAKTQLRVDGWPEVILFSMAPFGYTIETRRVARENAEGTDEMVVYVCKREHCLNNPTYFHFPIGSSVREAKDMMYRHLNKEH